MAFTPQQRRWFVPLLFGLLILGLDQQTKQLVITYLGPEPLLRSQPLLGELLSLVYWRNTGVAFGLFQDATLLLTLTSILICLGAIFVYSTQLPNLNLIVQISMGLIIGGALGNIIDRVRLGYVVDFIQVGWWPIFNLADSAITGGTLLLVFYLFLSESQQKVELSPKEDGLLVDLLSQELSQPPEVAKPDQQAKS
jgi:signal peptidase II